MLISFGPTTINFIVDKESNNYIVNTYSNFILNASFSQNTFDFTIKIKVIHSPRFNRESYSSFQDKHIIIYKILNDEYVDIEIDYENNISMIYLLSPLSDLRNSNSLEYCIRLSLLRLYLEKNMFLLHSAGVMFENKIFIFSGESGAGKTTTAKNFISAKNGIILNDDTMLIETHDSKCSYAYSVPYKSTSDLIPTNGMGEINTVFIIEKSNYTRVENLSLQNKLEFLLCNAFFLGFQIKHYENLYKLLLSNINRFIKNTTICKLLLENNSLFVNYI